MAGRAARDRFREHRPPTRQRLHGAAGQRRRPTGVGAARGQPRAGPARARGRHPPDRGPRAARRDLRRCCWRRRRRSRRRSASRSRSTPRSRPFRSSHSCATERSSWSHRPTPTPSTSCSPAPRCRPSSCSPPPRWPTATPRAAASSSCAAAATSAGAALPAVPARGSRGTLCVSDDGPGVVERLFDREVGDAGRGDRVEREAPGGLRDRLGVWKSGASGPSSSTISRPARRGSPLTRSASRAYTATSVSTVASSSASRRTPRERYCPRIRRFSVSSSAGLPLDAVVDAVGLRDLARALRDRPRAAVPVRQGVQARRRTGGERRSGLRCTAKAHEARPGRPAQDDRRLSAQCAAPSPRSPPRPAARPSSRRPSHPPARR